MGTPAAWGQDNDGFDANDEFGAKDCNGHGTHCAGIVGGKTFGAVYGGYGRGGGGGDGGGG